MRRTLAFASLAAMAGVLALGVGPGSAAKTVRIKTNTTVKIEPTGPTQARYSGKVTCTPPKGDDEKERKRNRKAAEACEFDRFVQVFHVQPGEDFLIGSAITSDRGGWQVIGNKPPAGDTVRVEVSGAFWGKFDASCRPKTKFATVPS